MSPSYVPENSIDCIRCGEKVSINDSVCPSCGLSLYPEDEDEPKKPKPPEDRSASVQKNRILAGVYWGLALVFLLFVVSTLIGIPLAAGSSPQLLFFWGAAAILFAAAGVIKWKKG
jgi:hypothetical protein